ncbi:MAG TPA: 4'-phosphopantetheinyl transferase superfamily protein [Variovorax sp.]|nr:4'-phosphopantetheinyl transferase superfamily protein [Variovorax sp.]
MSILVLTATEFALPAALEARWMADLPQPRRDALARWPDARARHRSLLGSRLLGRGLRRMGHRGDVLSSLRHPPRARPTLDLGVDFSVSHAEGRVLCAVSTSGQVGVDVETIGPLLAANFPLYLNADERAWAGGDARRFCSIWTRKEAVVKAAGSLGLAAMARVDTRGGPRGAEFAGRSWNTVEIPVGERHLAHLATAMDKETTAVVTIKRVTREALENADADAVVVSLR